MGRARGEHVPQQISANAAQRRIVREVVEVLGSSAALVDPQGRRQWRRELAEMFGDLEQGTYPTPRQEFIDTVRACCARRGGLELLLDATSFVAPALSHRLRPLADEWNAAELYEERDWTALQAALDIVPTELHATVASVTRDRVRLPSYCTTAWHSFLFLACRAAPPGGLPPSMIFLEHLALLDELAGSVGELYAWNDYFATQWQLADGDGGMFALRAELLQGRKVRMIAGDPGIAPAQLPAAEGGVRERSVIRVFIKLAPDLTPAEGQGRPLTRRESKYRLSARVKYAESEVLRHEPGADYEAGEGGLVSRNRLPREVAAMLVRMAEEWRSRADDVVLEFFLPTELLNEPVEWWDRDPRLGYANPLFSKYPEILVHSLERMQRQELHHAWRVRWARWKARPEEAVVHWCDAEGREADEHLAMLDARIGAREEIVAMVLSGPPRPRQGLGSRELRVGLDLGVPIFVHHRHGNTEGFRVVVRDGLSDGGLANLPHHARQWKGNVAARGLEAQEHPARHMNVIWDDPEHLLDGGPGAPAAFVGGIG